MGWTGWPVLTLPFAAVHGVAYSLSSFFSFGESCLGKKVLRAELTDLLFDPCRLPRQVKQFNSSDRRNRFPSTPAGSPGR
jgi:hypothetical protein